MTREQWESKFGGGRRIRWAGEGPIIAFSNWRDISGTCFFDTNGCAWDSCLGRDTSPWVVVSDEPIENTVECEPEKTGTVPLYQEQLACLEKRVKALEVALATGGPRRVEVRRVPESINDKPKIETALFHKFFLVGDRAVMVVVEYADGSIDCVDSYMVRFL